MMETIERVIAALVISCILCLSTVKMLGIVQQCGYRGGGYWRWLKRKDNLQMNRLSVLALCLALATAVTSLCFSFLGVKWGLICSAVPFFVLLLAYWRADGRYALKVPVKRTGRLIRLFGIYYVFTALFAYVWIAVLAFLAKWNGSALYGLIAYVPVAILPITLPAWLYLANAVTGVFENARNKKFVKRAGRALDEREIIRVAVVGSYGKTSVKNILKTLLSEKYTVVETPASYNTPVGIAKTVLSPEFAEKQVFIAEMGARRKGDIAELCALVQPDYALFTGVCAQHIQTFGSEENVFEEKSKVLRCGAKGVVCGEDLYSRVESCCGGRIDESILFAGASDLRDVRVSTDKTAFTLLLNGESVEVETKLLGRGAAENIAMAAKLSLQMGVSVEQIRAGIAKLQPIPHRLQRLENEGVEILDDGYNCNIRGARVALEVLGAATGRKCVVTPGIVEGGVLEEALNGSLGEELARLAPDKVILVGDTLVGAVKDGYKAAGGDMEKISVQRTLDGAQEALAEWVEKGDCVLFLNDLPDAY